MSDLFDKLAAEEEQFFNSEFLCPVQKGSKVRVRISGITVELTVRPKKYEGWGVFISANDQNSAKLVRDATLAEKQGYLKLYPKFSLVICLQGDAIGGIPANTSDSRFSLQGQVSIALPEETRLFDTVDVRFDGQTFWYDQHSRFRTARIATHLRDLLTEEVKPEDVTISGMTQEEKYAYALAFDIEIESKKDRKEERLKRALERGGAKLRSYMERGNTYTVEFTVDGERHRSTVDTETLQIASAGICLTDHRTGKAHDSDFDLQSLVGVIREGHLKRAIHRW